MEGRKRNSFRSREKREGLTRTSGLPRLEVVDKSSHRKKSSKNGKVYSLKKMARDFVLSNVWGGCM